MCLEQYMCMKSESAGWVKKSSIQLALVDSAFLVLTRLTFKGLQCPGWK